MAIVAPVLEFMPVGFRFRPTDEELVGHYLTNKLIGEDFVLEIIPEIEVCKHEPWDIPDIPAFCKIQSGVPEWFFFSRRHYKHSNSPRYNRTTERGFWKATGNDRKIKVRGTDEIIGTKKTLVFYRGRVPNVVKTNWVIHEYQAVAFPDDQMTFVLCKLIKKPEKAEGRTGDEGEPSSHRASDCEILASEDGIPYEPSLPGINLDPFFGTQHPADEVDLSSIHFSPVNEQEFSRPPFSPRLISSIGNDDSSVNLPFETTEEEDNPVKFVNSIIAYDDEEDNPDMFVNSILADYADEMSWSEGMKHAFIQSSESLRKVYCESSDTDAEVVSAQYGYLPETSTKSNKNDGPSSTRCVLSISELSSNQEKKGRSFQNDLDSSSGDSTAARPLKINRTKLASSASTLKTCKVQYQPRSAHSVSLKAAARRSQTHKKISTKEAYYEAQKETPEHSNNDKREAAQVSDKRKTSKAPSSASSGINGKGSLIKVETPLSNQNLSPPSVYLVNVVIGLVLFVVIIWEMLSCGKF